jgi:hypothetical protein
MNRKFLSVIAGGFGTTTGGSAAAVEGEQGEVVAMEAHEVAQLLKGSKEIMIIPGYGMAVAQAQHIVHEITKTLRAKKKNVRFGIHPVAGRMRGHMNVLHRHRSERHRQSVGADGPQQPDCRHAGHGMLEGQNHRRIETGYGDRLCRRAEPIVL